MDVQTLWTITGLAAVDMVNPCTLAVQVLLLSALVLTKGRKDATIGGILFTVTIYVMYLLYGLGVLQLIYALGIQDILRAVLKILILVMAGLELMAFFRYRPGFISLEMPMPFHPIAKKVLKSVENPWMAVPVAFLCSVLLLPCSSGPYLSAIILLANTAVEKILYLLYYNLATWAFSSTLQPARTATH
jgi:cytochrome c biogenesis protein CcdA